MKVFSERLKDLRQEKEMSIRQLAKATDLSRTAISQWENQKGEPAISTAVILAKFFGVTTDYLLGLED